MRKGKGKIAAVVRIEPDAGLPSIEGIHRTVVEQLAAQSIELDVSQVRQTDISFVQLILAATASAKAEGKSVSLSSPANEAIREVLDRGGFLSDAEARRFWLGEAP